MFSFHFLADWKRRCIVRWWLADDGMCPCGAIAPVESYGAVRWEHLIVNNVYSNRHLCEICYPSSPLRNIPVLPSDWFDADDLIFDGRCRAWTRLSTNIVILIFIIIITSVCLFPHVCEPDWRWVMASNATKLYKHLHNGTIRSAIRTVFQRSSDTSRLWCCL